MSDEFQEAHDLPFGRRLWPASCGLGVKECCQPGLQGVDVCWSGWKRRGSEQVSGDCSWSSGAGPDAGTTARRVDRVFSATARAHR